MRYRLIIRVDDLPEREMIVEGSALRAIVGRGIAAAIGRRRVREVTIHSRRIAPDETGSGLERSAAPLGSETVARPDADSPDSTTA